MNKKAQQYKKRQLKTEAAQNEVDQSRGQQVLTGLAMKLFDMEQKIQRLTKRLDTAEATSRYVDYRSMALQNLLIASGTYSEASILNEIEVMQVRDFEMNSAIDDKNNNLLVSTDAAATGMFAIVSLRLFKDGAELINEKVSRAKIELGKNELIEGIDDALFGMTSGQSKTIDMVLQDKTDKVEITLIGLRIAAPVEQTADATEQA
jgi:hypothetical protein